MRKKSAFLLILWVALFLVSACASKKAFTPPRPTQRDKGCGCELVQPGKSLEEHA